MIYKDQLLALISTFFIVSIAYHVSYPSNIFVFGAIVLLMPFMLMPKKINLDFIYISLFFTGLFIFYIILNMTIHEDVNDKLFYISIQKIGLSIVLFVFIILFYQTRIELFKKTIYWSLAVIVVLWYMQFFVFYSTGHYIDLIEPLAGRPQRYEAYFISAQLPFEVIRPTSIYIEPGTYGVNTVVLLILSYIANDNKINRLHILTLVSFFLSLSLFAIIVAILFIISIEVPKIKLKFSKKNMFFLLLLFLVLILLREYLIFRFTAEESLGAVEGRTSIVEYWWSSSDWDILLGQGHTTQWIKENLADNSFLFKLIFEFGILSIPYFLIIIYLSWGRALLFLVILLLTKINYQVYIVWFYFAGLYLLYHRPNMERLSRRA